MAKSERFAAFLFYVDDWLSCTAIDLMTAAEERGYLRLLLHAWKTPDCGLPDDDRVLAHLFKLGDAWHSGSGSVVRAEFFKKDGRLFNERLLRERDNQSRIRQSRSQAGKTGAETRWYGKHMANASQSQWQAPSKVDGKTMQAQAQALSASKNINHNPEHAEDERKFLWEALQLGTISDEQLERLYDICTDEQLPIVEEAIGYVDFDEPDYEGEAQAIRAIPPERRTKEQTLRLLVIESPNPIWDNPLAAGRGV